jgi:Transcriptional regulator, AbiEi antitoxin
MGPITLQPTLAEVLAVAARQHGVVTGAQLVARGLSRDGIEHRARRGRLFRVHRNVYAIGSPILTREGRWMAAVLACGAGAALRHESAAALWRIRDRERESIEVSVPPRVVRRHDGIRAHRRALTAVDLSRHRSIPVTAPACTLIDLAARLDEGELERAISEADKLGLTDPDRLLPAPREAPTTPRRRDPAQHTHPPHLPPDRLRARTRFHSTCGRCGAPCAPHSSDRQRPPGRFLVACVPPGGGDGRPHLPSHPSAAGRGSPP